MSRPLAGSVVIVDWRGGSLPGEPTRIRPGIVVEHPARFNEDYPMVLVVPLTRSTRYVDATFALRINPSAENGNIGVSWVLPHHITAASVLRLRETGSRITDSQLADIRSRIALALGLT